MFRVTYTEQVMTEVGLHSPGQLPLQVNSPPLHGHTRNAYFMGRAAGGGRWVAGGGRTVGGGRAGVTSLHITIRGFNV